MNSSITETLAAHPVEAASTAPAVFPTETLTPPPEPVEVRRPGFGFIGWVLGFVGLLWRWVVGAALCLNIFTSVLVVGWICRLMQGHVLWKWWKKSPHAQSGPFELFCSTLGPDAPAPRPRWFWRERIAATLSAPGPGGKPPSGWQKFKRALTIPWHSLWLNARMGVMSLFCVFLLTGWGCLLMYFGWVFGWLNSFHKGYEEAATGALVSLAGILLFILALYYVLMAQVHQAVTGDRAAFFDFRFVWKLVRARPTAYCFMVLLLVALSLPFDIAKVAVLAQSFFGNNETLPDGVVLQYYQTYLFVCCLFLFPALLLVRRVAANVYSSAVLKVLRQGRVTRAELHPRLAQWLDRLEIYPVPLASTTGLPEAARRGAGWLYRRLAYTVIFVALLFFVAKVYVSEFLVRQPVVGFLNHVFIQFPCFDFVPTDLRKAAG